MTPATIPDMLRRDREQWAALVAILDAHPGGPVHDPESATWEPRDVYNHFARWINHSTDDLEANLAGRTLARPEGTDDEINARWRAEDLGLSRDEARLRAQRAFDRRIAAIERVPSERWDNVLIAIAHADGYPHIEAHRIYIQAALKH